MSCDKYEFATWTLANRVAKAKRRRHGTSHRPYKCPRGSHFHVGSGLGPA